MRNEYINQKSKFPSKNLEMMTSIKIFNKELMQLFLKFSKL